MLPTVDFCGLTVTRLIIGANPFGGYSHQNRERDAEMVAYYTVDRIRETWARAEAAGINTMITNNETPHVLQAVEEYLSAGGRMQWIAQVSTGRDPSVEDAVDRAVAMSPRHTEPVLKRAALSLLENRHAEALKDLDRAVALDPDHPLVRLKRGVTYLALDRTAEAEADLLHAERGAPRLPEVQKHLGLFYAKTGDRAKASMHLRRFLVLERGEDPAGRAKAEGLLKQLGG